MRKEITLYSCDVCGREIRNPIKGWFEVKINGEDKGHLCHECGATVRNGLSGLATSLDFYCTEYGNVQEFGRIKVELPEGVKVAFIYRQKGDYFDSTLTRWLV